MNPGGYAAAAVADPSVPGVGVAAAAPAPDRLGGLIVSVMRGCGEPALFTRFMVPDVPASPPTLYVLPLTALSNTTPLPPSASVLLTTALLCESTRLPADTVVVPV